VYNKYKVGGSMKKKKEKNNSGKLKIYLTINSILLAWISMTTLLILGKYDILPFKYFMLILAVLIFIPGTLILLMLKKKIKPIIKKIASAFSIIIILILSVLLFYINKTFKFLDNLIETGYTIENYSVIVMQNSEYENIDDIKDKKLGVYKSEQSHINEALDKLDEVVTLEKIESENYEKLVDELYNNETDAIIIEESYRELIEESKKEFSKETKVIYNIEVKYKTESIVKNVDVKKETFNMYISGIDTYGDISSVSRSDVNIIATINPKTNQILLTTIPRDYYVQLAGKEGLKDKLTHAGIYGIDTSIKTLENLLDIEINYYMKVNFSSVEKIIEALGGVDVYSDYTFTGYAGTNFQRGYNRVTGTQALEFARTRKTVEGGDRTRGKNQQALIQAMIKKASSREIITKYTSLLSSLEGTFQTNMSTDKMTDLIKKQLDDMATWNVTSISLDGTNGSEYTYSYSWQQLYVMIPDETTIENAKQKIKEVTDNQTLEGSYIENTGYVNSPTKKTEEKKEEKKEEQKPVEEKPQEKEQETKELEKKEEQETKETEKKETQTENNTIEEKQIEKDEQKEETEKNNESNNESNIDSETNTTNNEQTNDNEETNTENISD
jgi:LCP family protein required for cell wall assembly